MMRNHFKTLVYIIVIVASFSAGAGSFEDFFVAIKNDNAGTLNGLLDRGFDPNTADEKGQPGLTIAMQAGTLNAARALLARPAIDVNALNQAGESALMMAALKGNLAGAQLLLDRGAKVNQSGWSPLHYAATGPEPRVVQLLLDRGAEIDAGAPNGTTPLMMAAQYGAEESVTLLLARGADVKRRSQLDLSAVDFARKAGRLALAERLEQAAR
jgi:uncharacterized protein